MNKRKLLALLMAVIMAFVMTGCGDDAEDYNTDAGQDSYSQDAEVTPEPVVNNDDIGVASPVSDGWAIYWYLCGSDLESNYGCATTDLFELMDAQLPDNVKVVIETGGSAVWQNDFTDAGKIQRYVYDSEGFYLVDEQESANMGDPQTLASFLDFARTNYPAEKTAVIFWNHGGGSLSGAAFDEVYGCDSLSLPELYAAFDAIWPANEADPALELVGFDTCLMATIDTADVFKNFAKYFVASEECEPGNGWYYTGWASELAANPGMTGKELGRAICDSYYDGCVACGTEAESTLALIDLSKISKLVECYDKMGQEALVAASDDAGFFAELGRTAGKTENYGGNTKDRGYTDMADLGHLARQTKWMLPSAQSVLDALDDCVLYKVNGDYRSESTGLSCYYSYDADVDNFLTYNQVGAGLAFKHLFAYLLTGEIGDATAEYLKTINIDELPQLQTVGALGWDGVKVEVNSEGTSYITLGAEAEEVLSSISFALFCVDPDTDGMMLMGTDNDITADWDNGIFYDNFRGVWGAINGIPVYMELYYEGDGYNMYSIPVLLNGEEYNLEVYYDFTAEEWGILGATQGLDPSGMASKEMRLLEVGDVIDVIWKIGSISAEGDDMENYTVDTITVDENLTFDESSLMDGTYVMVFMMEDAMGNEAVSEGVTFTCENGEISTTVY